MLDLLKASHAFTLLILASLGFARSAASAGPATQPTTAPSLTIEGELVHETHLDQAALAKLPHVSLDVKAHDGTPTTYRGIPLRTILTDAGLPLGQNRLRGKLLSYYLVVEAADGYKAVFALPEFDEQYAERSIILADERDGKPLSGNEAPLRLVVPQEGMQARWVRMITTIRVKKDQ